MSTRKGKRPPRRDADGRAGGRGGGRKPPPPEGTGQEARYFRERGSAGAPVRVVLLDGASVSGVVRESDREVLVVEPEIGEPVRVRKSGIRYVEEPAPPEPAKPA